MAIPGSDPDITFISGVTSSAQVAATSFWTWNSPSIPATYNPVFSFATKWGSTILSPSGTPGGNVTYWFNTASNWTATEKDGFLSALALWSAVANITFSLAADAASTNFTFTRGNDGSAFQRFPNLVGSTVGSGTEGGPGTGALISIDTNPDGGFGPIDGSVETKGGFVYGTMVHELGHMLGLGHAGPYNGDVNASTQQFSKYDTMLWSLMSYISPTDTTAQFFNQYTVTGTSWGTNPDGSPFYTPTTPMIMDILAVQRIYGAPTSGPLASGGQTFGFNCNVDGLAGRYFDFTNNTHPVITIWDGGTNNTLDLSGFSADSTINLTPGTFSSCNGMVNNIGIADGTIINHAVGGAGNDKIFGSSSSSGTFRGGGGNDFISSTSNLNTAFGDDGNDQLYFSAAQNQLFGSNGNDWLGVNGTNNALAGGSGDEVWIGASGNSNTLDGQDGNDAVFVNGIGNNGYGGIGNDWVGGSGSSNTLLGGAGTEWMGITGTSNAMNGGEGDDTLLSIGSNVLFGENGNDWVGCSGNANVLFGNAGNDYLAATGDNNVLDGGAGNDLLVAAAGQGATFVFHAGYGHDEITGFTAGRGTDVIDLRGFGFTSFAHLQGYMGTQGANTVLVINADTTLVINGALEAQFLPTDFLLA